MYWYLDKLCCKDNGYIYNPVLSCSITPSCCSFNIRKTFGSLDCTYYLRHNADIILPLSGNCNYAHITSLYAVWWIIVVVVVITHALSHTRIYICIDSEICIYICIYRFLFYIIWFLVQLLAHFRLSWKKCVKILTWSVNCSMLHMARLLKLLLFFLNPHLVLTGATLMVTSRNF